MGRLLAALLVALLALATAAASAAAADDDVGLGQRCVVHLRVEGATVHRAAHSAGPGNEWVGEPPWRLRPGQRATYETRGRRDRGCQSSVSFRGPGDERIQILLVNPIRSDATRRCIARGTGTFNCSLTKRPRTPRTVEIDVRIRFGRG